MPTYIMQSSVTTGKKPKETHSHNWPADLNYMLEDIKDGLLRIFVWTYEDDIDVYFDNVKSILPYLKRLVINGKFFLDEDKVSQVEREINSIIEMAAGDNDVPIKGMIKLAQFNVGLPLNPDYRLHI